MLVKTLRPGISAGAWLVGGGEAGRETAQHTMASRPRLLTMGGDPPYRHGKVQRLLVLVIARIGARAATERAAECEARHISRKERSGALTYRDGDDRVLSFAKRQR